MNVACNFSPIMLFLLYIFRRGDPPCSGLWVRVRDGVPCAAGERVPVPAAHRPRGHLQEEGARPRNQVSHISCLAVYFCKWIYRLTNRVIMKPLMSFVRPIALQSCTLCRGLQIKYVKRNTLTSLWQTDLSLCSKEKANAWIWILRRWGRYIG